MPKADVIDRYTTGLWSFVILGSFKRLLLWQRSQPRGPKKIYKIQAVPGDI